MLTSGQCQIAAFMSDGGSFYCPMCAEKKIGFDWSQAFDDAVEAAQVAKGTNRLDWQEEDAIRTAIDLRQRDAERKHNLQPMIQYEMDSNFSEDGCWCDDCGCEIVEQYIEPEVEMDDETAALNDHLEEESK
jgi:hypothetical protein